MTSANHKFILKCSCILCKKETTTQSLSAHYKSHNKQPKELKNCKKCNDLHNKLGVYCSYKCSNSRTQSQETNYKRSSKLKENHISKKEVGLARSQQYTLVSQCIICNKWFQGRRKTCSDVCLHMNFQNSGKKASSISIKRSTDEIKLFELCHNYFSNVSHNDPIFNGWDADIIIHDYKLAILWNGPWHYKEMPGLKHSLKQVQNRDKLKNKEIISIGWECIIFEDRYYTPETAFNHIKELIK